MIVMTKLTESQKKIVGKQIAKEFHLIKEARTRRRAGYKLKPIERRRLKRTMKQIRRIGFQKAREIDSDIPERDTGESVV